MLKMTDSGSILCNAKGVWGFEGIGVPYPGARTPEDDASIREEKYVIDDVTRLAPQE
jgi:hypothetical protein